MLNTKRIAMIVIQYSKNEQISKDIDLILAKFKHQILNKVEVADKQNELIISTLAKLTTDELGALTGALGRIKGVKLKSAVLPLSQ